MTLFEEENVEVKKLKKQVTAQDLRIGLLESERTKAQRQVDELNGRLSTLSASASQDSARATAAESALTRLQSDFNRQAVDKSNLQQALTKAEERYEQDVKARKFQEQQVDQARESQLRQEMQQSKKLEEKVKNLESRLRDKEEQSRRVEAATDSDSLQGARLKAQIVALENDVALLRADNMRLQPPHTIANDPGTASSSRSAAEAEYPTSVRGPARRGRASSLSGASPAASSPTHLASRAQLHDLQALYDEARSDLTKLEARATKAEREALKASNEVLAKEKQGEKVAAELRSEVKGLQEDLRWKQDECNSLAQELDACEKRLGQAEARIQDLDASKADLECQMQDLRTGKTSTQLTSSQEFADATKQLQQASSRCQEQESEIIFLRERIDASGSPNDSADPYEKQSALSPSQSEYRILKDLRRSLSLVTGERDTLKKEVCDLEEEVERLQSSQAGLGVTDELDALTTELSKRQASIDGLTLQLASLRLQLQESSEAQSSPQRKDHCSRDIEEECLSEKLARLEKDYSDLELLCGELQSNIAELESKLSKERQKSDALLAEGEDLREERQKRDSTHVITSDARYDDAEVQTINVQLVEEQLRSEVLRLTKELSDKNIAIEEADALAEEDSRQLRMKETEVKRLSDDLARLRQKAKEAALELEILRSSTGETGEVESGLKELIAQLNVRDDELVELRTSLKRREDELELGKKQLKRITTFIESRGSYAAAEADEVFATPKRNGKNGSVHKPRISFGVAATPIGSLLKAKHFFSTPGGKQIQRGFDEDLLDQIELIRERIEQTEEQQRFVNAERIASAKSMRAELDRKTDDAERVAVKLHDVEFRLAEVTSKQQCDAEAQRDSLLAERDLVIQQYQEQVAELEQQVARLQQQLESARSELEGSEAQLEAVIASSQSSKAELELRLEATNSHAAEVAELMQQLLDKRRQLIEIEATTRAVEQAESLLQSEENLMTHLEGSLANEERNHKEWTSVTVENQTSLADCRQWLQVAADRPRVMISVNASDDASSQLTSLRNKIDELQGRVLRREEQIGSLQLKLENVTTQQSMAEEDYEELMEEKVDLEAEVASLQQKLDSSVKENAEIVQGVKAEAEEANEALKATTLRLQEELRESTALHEKNVQLTMRTATAQHEQGVEVAQDAQMLRLELSESQNQVEQLQEELLQKQVDLDGLQKSLKEREGILLCAQEERLRQDQDTVAQLQQHLSDVESRALALSETNDRVTEELKNSADAIANSRREAVVMTERLSRAEASRDEVAMQLATLKEEGANGQTVKIIRSLEEQVSALTDKANSAQIAHEKAVQQLETDLAQALDSLKVAQEVHSDVDRISQELHEQTTEAHRLQEIVTELEESKRELHARYEHLETAAAESGEAAQRQEEELQKTIADIRSQIAALQEELANRQNAIGIAENAIKERDEHIKSRNEDFWTLKEELAELQEHQERSRAAASSVEMLEERLQSAQEENIKLREEIGKAEAEVHKTKKELETAEREAILKSSEVADLQGEMKRRKAANRFHEEENSAMKARLERAESALQESVVELKTMELQLKAARQEVERLEGELAAQMSAFVTQGASEELVEEMSYLKGRIEDMEQELSAKADEIEEADTRILTGLKENKKLSSRMKTLQRQIESLQSAASAAASVQPLSLRQAETSVRTPSGPTKEASLSTSNAALSPVSAAFSKKRPAPEESTSERAHVSALSVRAVYQPPTTSPQKGSHRLTPRREDGEEGGGRFTPLRRSPVKGEALLQDRTNTGRTPTTASGAAAMVKGRAGESDVALAAGEWSMPKSDKKIAPLPGIKERKPLAAGLGVTSEGPALPGGAGSGLMAALAKRKLTARA